MVLRLLIFCVLLFTLQTANAGTYTLKIATLMPTGTSWSKIFDNWVKEVETKSHGRIKIKVYGGGIMGDEPDVLRKIRLNELQGGMFTGYGIGRIFSSARVLEIPFLFRNTRESDYVRDKLMPDIKKGFRKNGFTLLGWPEIGLIHIFSKHKIESIDDIRKSRIWLWQGDPLGEAFFKAADISPVPLSVIDVYEQLSSEHSSIDTVYISTFGAIALQWYTKLKYATKIPFTNAIGGLVVSNRFFDKLPPDLQKLLTTTGEQVSDAIRKDARVENHKSIALLKQNGIKFVWDWNQTDLKQMYAIRDRAAAYLVKTHYISADFFNRARTLVDEYRKTHPADKIQP